MENIVQQDISIRFENITKTFGSVIANEKITFDVYRGEILSLLGENGSGKTTLMNMLSGIYFPDEGQIYINGKKVTIASPMDAFKHKIGMVHQHFKLIDVFTCLENIVLGIADKEKANKNNARKAIKELCDRYGFEINLDKKVYDLSVSEKQTLEILKTLYREAEILILDEPTAVLTPIEIRKLFSVLSNMRKDGKTIIIITHKLNEVMEISDRVAVLRKGQYIDTVKTSQTSEAQLTEMMVGKKMERKSLMMSISSPALARSLASLASLAAVSVSFSKPSQESSQATKATSSSTVQRRTFLSLSSTRPIAKS